MKNPVIDNKVDKRWFNEKGEYHRINGPAVEFADGYKSWWMNGNRHRLYGPAIEMADGYKSWWVSGKRHRIDGPAIEYSDGDKSWYLFDKGLSEELYMKLTIGDIEDLPLYLGRGFDDLISERLKK